MSKKESKFKSSLILGGLVGTGGLFIAKLISLFYAIPFSSILASDAYMSYYGTAYRIYSYILNIFTAGVPLAISALVAKYLVKDDYKTVLIFKRLAFITLTITGFLGMLLMLVVAGFMAPSIAMVGDEAIVKNVFRLLSLAILFVPILSAFRGYYQGHKEMKQFAFSQSFEQIFRVGFLLSFAYISVYLMGKERKWALYFAVLSTSVAAIAGIAQFVLFDRKSSPEIDKLAKAQNTKTAPIEELFKELISLAIPYLIMAVMGYSDDLLYSILMPKALKMHGYSEANMSTILSAFNYVGTKMNAIPMILAPGFSTALIPHITEAVTLNDHKRLAKNVKDCVNIILYVGLPVTFCIFLYAEGIYKTLFYTDDFALAVKALQWLSIEGFLSTITPIVSSIMMALGLRKVLLKRLAVYSLIKLILIVPLIYLIGYSGAVVGSLIGCIYILIFNFKDITTIYHVNFSATIRKCVKICLSLLIMMAVCSLLRKIGLDFTSGSKLVCLIKMIVNGLLTVGVYFGITWFMRIPQTIFHIGSKS